MRRASSAAVRQCGAWLNGWRQCAWSEAEVADRTLSSSEAYLGASRVKTDRVSASLLIVIFIAILSLHCPTTPHSHTRAGIHSLSLTHLPACSLACRSLHDQRLR